LEGCEQFDHLRIVACSDLLSERAQTRALEFNIPKVCTTAELLADSAIDLVLNLTEAQAHAEIGMAALESGKHLYQEKPLTVELEDALAMLEFAEQHNLLIGCAPDTFMGSGLQTCRKLIDEGAIGRPLACTAFVLDHGHEDWHPNPDSFYRRGGGPMFDMGPYYLTALINLLGPIGRVTASSKVMSFERIATSPASCGRKIPVTVPTHVNGILEFVSGVAGTIITSFDVWATQLPSIEVYGTEGTLSVPDPNTYDGPVRLFSRQQCCWLSVPLIRGFTGQCRGLGIAEMVRENSCGRVHRANGEMAYHVLEIMHAFENSSRSGKHIDLISTCSRPDPVPDSMFDDILVKSLTS
jgi:predicted dehydrogenase